MPTDYNDWRRRQIEDKYDKRDRELRWLAKEEQEEDDGHEEDDDWSEFIADVIIPHAGGRND